MKHESNRSKHTTCLNDVKVLIKLIDKISNQPKINIGIITRKSPKSLFVNINVKGNLAIFKIGTNSGIQEIVVSYSDNIKNDIIMLQKEFKSHKIFSKYRVNITNN